MKALVNKKGLFNYEILEKIEAGLKLTGTEVKSLKNNRVSFEGSYISIIDGEAFWVKATIPAFQPKNISKNYDPERPRKLLLNQKELKYLIGKSEEKGLTIIPTKVYNKQGLLKLEIGIARRKKRPDKREVLKKRDIDREIRRNLKF